MEVDHMSFIFGSFSRRQQSQEVNSFKRRSIEPPKIVHDRSRSAPHTSKKTEVCSPRSKSIYHVTSDDAQFKCPMCQRHFVEPRVLSCLHTFCTKCLQQLQACDLNVWEKGSNVSFKTKTEGARNSSEGSGGSGYGSDKRETEGSWSPSAGRTLSCPACGVTSQIPTEGVSGLPLHYILQHRMVLATLNAHATRLLCDLCTTDVEAVSRCTECAINLCNLCSEIHCRQRGLVHHEVLSLEEARRNGITRIRTQIMCPTHAEQELSIFCSSCYQVVCDICASSSHRGHKCELASRASKSYTTNMQQALEKARFVADQDSVTASRLQATSKRIQVRCNAVQAEVECFIESYIRALDEHRKNLFEQVNKVRDDKLKAIDQHQIGLQKRLKETKDVLLFADELLTEGTDVEILSFVKPVLKKLEHCNKYGLLPDLRVSESLQFLPEEVVKNSESSRLLYGAITTQTVSPKDCILRTDGLQNLRVGRKSEAILEARDKKNSLLQRGGEHITAELRYRDASVSKSLNVKVDDRRDGTYCLSFSPDVPGKLLLAITIKGHHIKDSPFPVIVRTSMPHHGTFHCCSFCSSGGSKEAACGCGGKMPGGYRGCGHGHEGHPGRRHWSCCGNTQEHSECASINLLHYQFTL